jgi:fermentation-respiration switch protein FrsA (DUF1100 family)
MLRAIGLFAIIGGLAFLYIKYLEDHSLYYPSKDIQATPASLDFPFEDVYLKTQDKVTIHAWFIPNPKADYTLYFCHGNAGNISHRLDKIYLLYKLDLNIFIIDYRGYGRSQGTAYEAGFYRDAAAGYEYLVGKRQIPANTIIIYGESLGAAIGIDLASKKEVKALIIEGGFSSGRDMADIIYPFIPTFLISNKFDCLTKIKHIKAAKLFIHALGDEIVPIALAKKLYAASSQPKYFQELPGSHNSAFFDSQKEYTSAIKSFLGKLNE